MGVPLCLPAGYRYARPMISIFVVGVASDGPLVDRIMIPL